MPKAYGTAGPRAIYPDMCDSRTLARCGLMANALFPRLIVQADDQGRLHGDSTDMAGLCFPKMPKVHRDIPKAMDELVAVGAILRYEVDGEPYVQVAGWWDYQAHQRRSYPSRYPAPEGWTDRVYGLWKADKGEAVDDLPQPAAVSGGQPPVPELTPQPAATHVRANQSPSIPVSSIPFPSALSGSGATAERPTIVKDMTTKKKPLDEEQIDDLLRKWPASKDAPAWRQRLAEDLRALGIHDPDAELTRRAA